MSKSIKKVKKKLYKPNKRTSKTTLNKDYFN